MTNPVPSDGGLVLGAPDEPIRRQRQMVDHLQNIDDRMAEDFGETQAMRNVVRDLYRAAQSSRIALWAIAVILLIHVTRHW
jgi:t-SNARE complex subunit (syntaxin)